MRVARLMVVIPAMLLLAACADDGPTGVATDAAVAGLNRGAAGQSAGAPGRAARTTIVDVALAVNAQTGEFSTLIAAVLRADLAGALAADGQRTVFAPTDAAFAKLGLDADNIDGVPLDALTDILLYHVTGGRRDAASVTDKTRIRMLNGGFTRISVQGDGAYINDAKIVAVDIAASNGIIHVIDAVLLP
jgi:uncharacterized surface protein with fasciclin (FAS1) repeats